MKQKANHGKIAEPARRVKILVWINEQGNRFYSIWCCACAHIFSTLRAKYQTKHCSIGQFFGLFHEFISELKINNIIVRQRDFSVKLCFVLVDGRIKDKMRNSIMNAWMLIWLDFNAYEKRILGNFNGFCAAWHVCPDTDYKLVIFIEFFFFRFGFFLEMLFMHAHRSHCFRSFRLAFKCQISNHCRRRCSIEHQYFRKYFQLCIKLDFI